MPPKIPESTHFSFELKNNKKQSLVHKVGLGLGATALSVMGSTITALDIDTKIAYAFDTLDPPSTSVYDPKIVAAKNPEQEAKVTPINPELIKKCRESDLVVVHFSGTSMETSHYAASVYNDLVEEYGGCSMFHWSGYRYDPDASALSVERSINEVAGNGEKKKVVFIGSSLGGTLAQDIATHESVINSDSIDLERVIIIAAPKDLEDINTTILGIIPVSWLKHLPLEIPLPAFGRLPIFVQAMGGQVAAGDITNKRAWDHTIDNVSKVRPQLTLSELERLRRGMHNIRQDVSIDYIGSSTNDNTVNVKQAVEKISQYADVTFTEVGDGAVHGDVWHLAAAGHYWSIIEHVLRQVSEKEA